MPIYEYKCDGCKEVREKLRPVSEHKLPLDVPCNTSGCKGTFKRILSPTPTTFRFNDFTGFKGLDKRRPGH